MNIFRGSGVGLGVMHFNAPECANYCSVYRIQVVRPRCSKNLLEEQGW